MQNVHKLTLVLVQALCLNVEYRIGIYFNSVVFLYILAQLLLVVALDFIKFPTKIGVVYIFF